MNRSGWIDSNLSLDAGVRLGDSMRMIAQPYHLYIERRDPARNMERFYALSIEETLFGQPCLVRRWGRIGTEGRTVQHSFEDESDAVGLFLAVLRLKRRRGYQPRSIPLSAQTSGRQVPIRPSISNRWRWADWRSRRTPWPCLWQWPRPDQTGRQYRSRRGFRRSTRSGRDREAARMQRRSCRPITFSPG